jgi:beta-galactosidase/beta-glucuronidase
LPDTSRAEVTVQAELHNASGSVQQGVLTGAFEGVKFANGRSPCKPVKPRRSASLREIFRNWSVRHPRLWWPNGYGKPELYHLQLHFVTDDKKESDAKKLRTLESAN